MLGLELNLKLCIQTEWAAAADMISTMEQTTKLDGTKVDLGLLVLGIRRPLLIVPCGGSRMQLLSQISQDKFTIYPSECLNFTESTPTEEIATSLDELGTRSYDGAKQSAWEKSMPFEVEDKRKCHRDDLEHALIDTKPSDIIDTNGLSSAAVDRHRKIRFVEGMSNDITGTKEERDILAAGSSGLSTNSEFIFDSVTVDNMNDEEIESFLGRVLMRFVQVSIKQCSNEEELHK